MNINKMKAKIVGVDCEGNEFEEVLEFELIPPKEHESHYGTGYYMNVKFEYRNQLVDVRYGLTTDIEILADRWMKVYYGKNAKKITVWFE